MKLCFRFPTMLLLAPLAVLQTVQAEQFVLFDKTFTFEEKDAVPTKSHLHVYPDDFGKETPKDWTAPIDYRNGSVHVRMEVLEKPAGDQHTYWSLCYIPVKGQKNNYGCLSSPGYTKVGIYEKDQKMTAFWENDSIIWTEGIKAMSLVIKGDANDGKSHSHLQPDLQKFFPTKLRVTMVQVSKGAKYDASKVPGLKVLTAEQKRKDARPQPPTRPFDTPGTPKFVRLDGKPRANPPVDADGEDNWHQPAGPNGNWQTDGTPPTEWSATRNENIRWRTPMPETGMSGVTVWGDRVFATTHVPIKSEAEKDSVTDIIGFCLDANTGGILWQVTLPGTAFISLAGGFTDGTVFAPITDGEHVWFFNRCGSMGCYDMTGKEVWRREWKPRFKHNNRQAEPYLVGDAILYVEVANKAEGAQIQKWVAPGKKSKGTDVPAGVDEKEVWTYLHGIDKRTGKVLWREKVGTVIHNTPTVGMMADGKLAVSHSRGGPHRPFEKPAGQSLTSLAPGEEGKTLWSTELQGYDPSFASHWNAKYVFGFRGGKHVVLDANSGELLREQPLYTGATVWKFGSNDGTWTKQTDVAAKAGKGHPNTNQANIVIGDWHWFLSHNVHNLGRVHVETGEVEYLELPAQLMPSTESREHDVRLWGKGNPKNRPLNAAGFNVGDKGNNGTGWGHISAASPTLVGRYLFLPVVTGTVYVIDTQVKELSPEAIVAVNDLGPGGETWTLATVTYAKKRLYAHTMKEIICIEDRSK